MKPYIHKINYYETDKMGVTHHSNYIRMMEEARVYMLDELGWGYDRMEREGIISPVMDVSGEFKKTTTFPEELTVFVYVEKCSAFKLFLKYEFKRGEEVVFTGTSTHCFLDTEGRPQVIQKTYPELFEKLTNGVQYD